MNKALGFRFDGPKVPEPVRRDTIQPGTMYSHTASPSVYDVQVALATKHVALDKQWVHSHPHMGVNLITGEPGFSLPDQMVYPLAAMLTVNLAVEW